MTFAEPKNTEKRTLRRVDSFSGLNTSYSAPDGALTAAQNMCADAYPALKCARPPRVMPDLLVSPSSLGSDEKIFYVDGSNFVYDGVVRGRVSVGKKKFASLADTVVIFPDRHAFSHKSEYYHFSYTGLVRLKNTEGVTHITKLTAICDTLPGSASDGDIVYNNSDNKIYTMTSGIWSPSVPSFTTTYVLDKSEYFPLMVTHTFTTLSEKSLRFQTTNENGESGTSHIKISFLQNNEPRVVDLSDFKVGDKVTFRGIHTSSVDENDALVALANGTVITKIAGSYMIVENTGRADYVSILLSDRVNEVVMTKVIPPLECVMTVGDRIWGAVGNTIYASAPGDVTEWSTRNGAIILEADTASDIIGCADHAGVPVFFTKDAIIRVYTVYNGYKLNIIPAPGLSEKHPDSVACVAGSLYYVSDAGIMRYSGNSPKQVTFECEPLSAGAIGRTDMTRYYLANGDKLYVYSPECDAWYYYSVTVTTMCGFGTGVAVIGSIFGTEELLIYSDDNDPAPTVYPTADFIPWDTDIVTKKTYYKLYIEMKASTAAPVYISIEFDNGKRVYHTLNGDGTMKLYTIELVPVKSDYIKLSVYSNIGDFVIKSVTREFKA